MIHQVLSVRTQTQPLIRLDKALIQARNLQARLKKNSAKTLPANDGQFWSPMTSGPFVVPVNLWFD